MIRAFLAEKALVRSQSLSSQIGLCARPARVHQRRMVPRRDPPHRPIDFDKDRSIMTAATRRRSKLSGRSLEQVRAAQRFFDPSRAGTQTVQAYDCAVVV